MIIPGHPGPCSQRHSAFLLCFRQKASSLPTVLVATHRRQPYMTKCLLVYTSRKHVKVQAMKALSAAHHICQVTVELGRSRGFPDAPQVLLQLLEHG